MLRGILGEILERGLEAVIEGISENIEEVSLEANEFLDELWKKKTS